MELLKTNKSTIYGTSFFDQMSQPAMRSARPVAALIYNLLQAGTWLTSATSAHGSWPLRIGRISCCTAARDTEPSGFGLGAEVPRGAELEWVHVSATRHNRPRRQAVRRVPGTMWMWSKVELWIR
jgi:hypothetical protein